MLKLSRKLFEYGEHSVFLRLDGKNVTQREIQYDVQFERKLILHQKLEL
jgi:hypothetical protein